MREIKFRAWDKEVEKMLVPIDLSWGWGEYKWLGGDNQILMQYTGLKDKNGKEIYESDIVTAHYFWFNGSEQDGEITGEIKFEAGCYFIEALGEDDNALLFHDTSHFDEPCIEVIGNIYENPELLDKK